MKLHKHTGLLICIICLLMAAGGCSKKETMTGAEQAEEIVTDNDLNQDEVTEESQEENMGSEDAESKDSELEGNEAEISETENSESENSEAGDLNESDKESEEGSEEESKEEGKGESSISPTAKPEVTKAPEATAKPTESPKPTKKPEATAKPTSTPKPTKKPEATKAPQPTKAPTATVAPTATPEPTKTPEPTEAPAKKGASISDILQAVKKAYGENYMPVMSFDSLTISELYKVDASWYEEAVGEGPMMSTHVDVFLGFKAKSGNVDQIKAALTTYRDYLINESMQYPMNIEKVQNAAVYQNGDYVFFLMLGGYREDVDVADYNKLAVQTIDSVIAGK